MNKLLAACALAALSIGSQASAATITYTVSGTFTGSFEGTPFDLTAVFKGVGNTNSQTITSDGSRNVELTSFTANAAGQTFSFQAPSIRFGTNAGYAGIIVNVDGKNPFVFTSNDLIGYDGISAVSTMPVNFYGSFGGPFVTDKGSVTFSGGSDLTFGASVAAVPEPATWAMMIGGFGVVGGALRRRRTVRTTVSFA